MSREAETDQVQGELVNRRSMLRSGGATVATAVAGLTLAEVVTARNADAAAGDPIVMGAANNAGTSATSLTSANTGPTLAIANTVGRAPLRLVEEPVPVSMPTLGSGDLVNYDGDLYYAAGGTGGPFIGFVYTEVTATQVVTIKPQRILDTRSVAGRAHITNPAGNLDSAGRLLAGHTIVVSLGSLEVGALAAFCNMTAVSPLNAGFLTLWPGGTRPGTSSLNYITGAVVANFAVTGTSLSDTVSIFSSATSHVLLDITAFSVGNPGQINPAILSAAASAATSQRISAHTRAGTLPSWYQRR